VSASLKLLVVLALRSLVSHRIKSLIVGSLMLFGTFLVVLGTSMLDSISTSMEKSIVSSLTGHVQVYDASAKDKLQIFGGMGFGSEDIGEIPRFEDVDAALRALPQVEDVVPMAVSNATFTGEGELDAALAALRKAVTAADAVQMKALGERTRQIVGLLIDEEKLKRPITADPTSLEARIALLEEARTDAKWATIDNALLDWLDGQIAPLAPEGQIGYVRYVGTDLDQFAKRFDRFEIADGQMVPTGQRGILFSKRGYEDYMKNPVAILLDQVHRDVFEKGKKIGEDKELGEKVRRMSRQYQRVLFQLDAEEAAALLPKLKAETGADGDLPTLLQKLLLVDDANLQRRRDFFYAEIAPRIDLYMFKIGDVITLRSFTKTGYIRATNVKVWGTFQFKGLERSDLAGSTSLADMMTFRDLYGQPSSAMKGEVAAIKGDVKEVARDDAESALFGGGDVVGEAKAGGFDEFQGKEALEVQDIAASTFDPAEQRKGLVLHAAVILKDPGQLQAALADITRVAGEKQLGIQAIDWRTASGLIGQFILVVAGVLYTAIFIIFLVTIVIINNSMVMATMDRVAEIGTMRALGAQRRFVLGMFLFETVVLGAIAGALGALLGVAVVMILNHNGIPATTDILTFMFAGPALHPTTGVGNIVFGLVLILIVSVVATAYPALIATRIQPVVAMHGKE
jgi:ABC-type lipoprotein release transport system permease subunit